MRNADIRVAKHRLLRKDVLGYRRAGTRGLERSGGAKIGDKPPPGPPKTADLKT